MSRELDRELSTAQAAVVERYAPGTRSRRVGWSGGETRGLGVRDGQPPVVGPRRFGDAAPWAPVPAPPATGRRVGAVDLPGHGLADPFDYENADLADVATTFLGDVLDALGL